LKHSELILLIYKHRSLIERAYSGELIEDLPNELVKDIPIFQKVAKKYELSDSYMQFANTMLKRVDANYRFGDYNEEIKLLIEQKELYQSSKDKIILARMKGLVRTLYKKIEQRDILINARINDIVNDNDASIELIIKDALDVDARISELIVAYSINLKVLGIELRGINKELDEMLIDICLDLIPLTENIHSYNAKLSDFILRTEKRKLENKQLMSIGNKIIKEQDDELNALLLSNHGIYLHTLKEKNNAKLRYCPTLLELKKDSFLDLLSTAIEIGKVSKKAIVNKPYMKSEDAVLKAINIKKIENDLLKNKPENIFEFIFSHFEIQKFKEEQEDRKLAFKTYLTIIQNYRDNICLKTNYKNNIRVAKWI